MTTVLQPWVEGLRGPDAPGCPNIKIVGRWMRSLSQWNADPSKDYMRQDELPQPLDLCDELEMLPCHFVHHFADALAVIAYGHTDRDTAWKAAGYHYRIAEELFHFMPESAQTFWLRHRDYRDDHTEEDHIWAVTSGTRENDYIATALARFEGRTINGQ
jgi:hypothetical protein